MQNKEIKSWLETIPVLDEADLTSAQRDGVVSLIGDARLKTLLGLLLGQKQAKLFQLAAIPLQGGPQIALASVLQGETKGIDAVRDTLLEQAIRADAGEEEQNHG